MEKKINIAELLKDCPKGMELDCLLFENTSVYFSNVTTDPSYPIEIKVEYPYKELETFALNKYGAIYDRPTAKCVIFPKGKTSWEGFQKPFKDGDIISDGMFIAIFHKFDEGHLYYRCWYHLKNNTFKAKIGYGIGYIKEYIYATEEEKEILFQAIKDNGYKWNSKTKTLDKIKPKFKVNDQVKHIYDKDNRVITIIGMKEEYYDIIYFNNRKDDFQCEKVLFADQDKYELIPNKFDITSSKKATQHKFKVGDRIKHRWGEIVYSIVQITEGSYVLDNLYSIPISVEYMYDLVPNKFDITTLKPFESKVLVRDTNTDKWRGAFYSYYSSKKFYTIGSSHYYQCIPYKGNEYLLGTTDDCDEYYKTWE